MRASAGSIFFSITLSPQKTQCTDDIKLYVVLDGIYLLPLKNSSLFLIIYWTALAAAISLGLSTLTQHLFLVGLGHPVKGEGYPSSRST